MKANPIMFNQQLSLFDEVMSIPVQEMRQESLNDLVQEQEKGHFMECPAPLLAYEILDQSNAILIQEQNRYSKLSVCKCGEVSTYQGNRLDDEGCDCEKPDFSYVSNIIQIGQEVMFRAVHVYPDGEAAICFSFQEKLIDVPSVYDEPWTSEELQTPLEEVGTLRFQLDGEVIQTGLVELTTHHWRIGSAMHPDHPENDSIVISTNCSSYDLNESASSYVETLMDYECGYYFKPTSTNYLNQKVKQVVCYVKVADEILSIKHPVAQRHPYFHLLPKQDRTAAIGSFAEYFQASYTLYTQYPHMEQVCKGGFYQIASDWIYAFIKHPTQEYKLNEVLKPGSNLTEIMGFDKGMLKVLRKEDISYQGFKMLQSVHAQSPLHAESLRTIMENVDSINFDVFWQLIQAQRAGAVELIMYLRSCWNQQGIRMNEALLLWRDYIEMALEVNVPYKKFPPMLKLAHDVLARDVEKLRDNSEQAMFKRRAKKLDYLNFEDEETGYGVFVPQKCEDLVVEGRTLNHCVGSYQRRVAEGKTTVVFIRKLSERETPLYTMEWDIDKQEIIQLRAKSNADVKDKPALACIKKWREYQRQYRWEQAKAL